jgi:hypothetical protein
LLTALVGCDPGEPEAPADPDADASIPLGPWGAPQQLLTELAMEIDDAIIAPDGESLYFSASGVPTDVIWRASWDGAAWVSAEEVVELRGELGGGDSLRLTADGGAAYFQGMREGAVDRTEIFRSTLDGAGVWSTPVHLPELSSPLSDSSASPCAGDTRWIVASDRDTEGVLALYEAAGDQLTALADVNAGGDAHSAFVTEDCLTLYFSSARAGTRDLYVTTRAAIGEPWASPTLIEDLSTPDGEELDPWVSSDGRHLVFSDGYRIFEAFR